MGLFERFDPSLLGQHTPTNTNMEPGKVMNFLSWKDPIQTGVVFGNVSVFFILTTLGGYTVLSVVSYILLLLVIVSFMVKLVGKFYAPAAKLQIPTLALSEETVGDYVETFVELVNRALAAFTAVFSGSDFLLSAKFAGGLYVTAKVGNWLSGTALMFTAFLLAFTVPKVYEMNKAKIDEVLALVMEKVSAGFNEVLTKVPKAIDIRGEKTATTKAATHAAAPEEDEEEYDDDDEDEDSDELPKDK